MREEKAGFQWGLGKKEWAGSFLTTNFLKNCKIGVILLQSLQIVWKIVVFAGRDREHNVILSVQ